MEKIKHDNGQIQGYSLQEEESSSMEYFRAPNSALTEFTSNKPSKDGFNGKKLGITFLFLGVSQCIVTGTHFAFCTDQNTTTPAIGPGCTSKSISMGTLGLMCVAYGTGLCRPDLYIAAATRLENFCQKSWDAISDGVSLCTENIAARINEIREYEFTLAVYNDEA